MCHMTTQLSSSGSVELPPLTQEQHKQKYAHYASLKRELAKTFHGTIALRGETLFAESVAIFNDAAPLGAWIVVYPSSVTDISNAVKFCSKHSLSPSLKSGGYATAGWSIQGDIVIDTKRLDDVQLHLPKRNASEASAITGSSSRSGAAGIVPSADHGTLHTEAGADGPEMTAQTNVSTLTVQTDSAGIIDSVAKQQLNGLASGLVESKYLQERHNGGKASKSKRVRPEDSDSQSSSEDCKTQNVAHLRRRVAETSAAEAERSSSEPQQPLSKIAANSSSSNESGADADSESSYASSEHNEEQRDRKLVDGIEMPDSGSAASSRQEFLSASEPRDSSEQFPASSQSGRRIRKWTNRQMQRTGNTSNSSSSGSNSGSNGGASSSNKASSSTSVSKTSTSPLKSPTAPTTALDKTEPFQPPCENLSDAVTDDATKCLRSTRSQQSQSAIPSGLSAERITLPEGSFSWTSDGTMSGFTCGLDNPAWDTQAFTATTSNTYRPQIATNTPHTGNGSGSFAASTLTDLQDAWPTGTWAVNTDAINDSSSKLPRFMSSPMDAFVSPPASGDRGLLSSDRGSDSSPVATSVLPAGIYKERYALASFGPGAGIRALDAFTDRAGRDANILAHRDDDTKGKAKDDMDKDIPLVVNGVPYHIPGSAYPVGSTSMTVGGFGYLTRAYGLSLDNIVEVQMVLADGRIVTLNDESNYKTQEERDLWWAVRGAAPCFGIVSRLTVKAYPVPSVYSGNLIYPLNPATASSLIRHWRDCLKSGLPRTFYSNLILTAGPSKTSHVIVIQVCFLGSKSEGEALVHMISSWTGERLLLKDVEERSFLSQQDGVAKVLKGGQGRRWMVRGDLISTLTDEVISQSVRKFQGLGSRAVWLFELLGGAVEDTPVEETCIGSDARSAKFVVGSLQQWSGEADDRSCIENVDRWLSDVVGKVSIGGPYPCFLSRSEPMDRVMGSFGLTNFRRLLQIKKRVDPHNLFRNTFGEGLGVENTEQLLAQLEVQDGQRRALQQEASASASNRETSAA